MKSSIIILVALTLLIACKEEKTSSINKYFDLKTTISNQINILNTKKPSFNKTVWSNNIPESKLIKIEDWSKELELFLQTDLNKPAYLNSYDITQSDSTIVYTLKAKENLPAKSVKIYLQKGAFTALEATITNENYLYETDKHIKMTLANGVVDYYLIEGTQKLVFGDKKAFKIEAKAQK